MDEHSVVRYWRNSLADEATLTPDMSKAIEFDPIGSMTAGILPTDLTDRLFAEFTAELKRVPGQKDGIKLARVPALLSLYVIAPGFEHGRFQRESTKKYPLWIPGRVDRQGNLLPTADSMLPWIARSCLEPGGSVGAMLGCVDDSDLFYRERAGGISESSNWADIIKFAIDLLRFVCGGKDLQSFAAANNFRDRQKII